MSFRLIVAALCVALFAGGALAADAGPGLDGVWEGTLTVASAPSAGEKAEQFGLRVEINGESARVWFKGADKWTPIERPFRVQRLRSNAVVTSIESGQDDEGVWVETWSVALAQKSEDAALAIYSRLVNNENLPLTSDHKAFSAAATGELKRSLSKP